MTIELPVKVWISPDDVAWAMHADPEEMPLLLHLTTEYVPEGQKPQFAQQGRALVAVSGSLKVTPPLPPDIGSDYELRAERSR